MTRYRINYLDANGQIFASETVQCDTEMEGIHRAQAHRDPDDANHGFELWSGDRCVYTERASLPA